MEEEVRGDGDAAKELPVSRPRASRRPPGANETQQECGAAWPSAAVGEETISR